MKRVSIFIICFILMMANNAFAGDDRDARRDPSQVRHHQVVQNNAAGMTFTDYLPQNWTPLNRKMAGIVTCVAAICGISISPILFCITDAKIVLRNFYKSSGI